VSLSALCDRKKIMISKSCFIKSILIFSFFALKTYCTTDTLTKPSEKIYRNYLGISTVFLKNEIIPSFSYCRWHNNSGVRIDFLPFYWPFHYPSGIDPSTVYVLHDYVNGYKNTSTFYFGLNYLKKFTDMKYFQTMYYLKSIYIFQIVHENYCERIKNYGDTIVTINHIKGTRFYNGLSIGGGLGGDMSIWRFVLNILAGYNIMRKFEGHEFHAGPAVEFNIYYKY
jgi:hypothetical protein